MPDQKNPSSPVEAATAAPGEKRAASRPLAKASESGNPDVQKAIGDLETARLNLAAAKREGAEDPDAEQSAKAARAALRELGYEE